MIKQKKKQTTSGPVSTLKVSKYVSGEEIWGDTASIGLEAVETDVTLEIYTVRFREQRL